MEESPSEQIKLVKKLENLIAAQKMVLQHVLATTVPVQSKQPRCREAISKFSTTQANPENKMKELTKEFNQNMSRLEIAQSKKPHSNSFKSQQTKIRRTFEMVGRALDPQRNISRKEYDEMLRKMLLTAKRLKLASSSNVSGKNGAASSKAELPLTKQKTGSDLTILRVKSSRKSGNLNQNLRRVQLAQQHSKLRASSAQSTSRISGTSVRNLDLLQVNFSQKRSKTTAKKQLSSSSNLSSKMEVHPKKQKLNSDLSSLRVKSPPEKPGNLNRNLSYLRRAQLAQQHSKLRAGSAQSTSRISGTLVRNLDLLKVNFSQKTTKTTAKRQLPSCLNLSSKMEKLYNGSPSSRLESPTEKRNGRNQVKTEKISTEERPMILRLPKFAQEEGFLKIPFSSSMTTSSKPASAPLLKAPSSENSLPKLPSGISLTPVKRELTTASEGIVLDISKKQHIDHALSKNESTVEESKKRVSSPSSSKTSSCSSNSIPTFTTWCNLQASKSDCSKIKSGLSQHLKPQVSKRSKEPSSMPKDNRGLSKSSQSNPKTASSTPKTSASNLNKVDQQKTDNIRLNSMYSAVKQEESTSNLTSVLNSAAAASPPRQGGFYFPFPFPFYNSSIFKNVF